MANAHGKWIEQRGQTCRRIVSRDNDTAHCALDAESALCIACGLCCNGAMFDYVSLERDDSPPLIREELNTPEKRERGDHFVLPCQCLDGTRCAIYSSRPSVCRHYRCALLKRHEAGQVTTAQAQAIIERARSLHFDAQQANGASMPQLREALSKTESLGSVPPEALAGRLRYIAMQRHIDTHFREASQRHISSMSGGADPD